MKATFVERKNVDLVLEGLKRYYKFFTEVGTFSPADFKNFMEPIFSEAGYRQHNIQESLNILIIHDAGVGDFILMSPAIREIRRLYPTAYITMVIYPRALDLAEFCPYVDEIIPNVRNCNWFDFADNFAWNISFVEELLTRRFQIVYAFTHHDCTQVLSYMSGARKRISHQFTEDNIVEGTAPFYIFAPLMTLEVPQQLYGIHTVDNMLGLLDYSLHSPIKNREIEVWFSPLDFTMARRILQDYEEKKLYALCMGGENPAKRWPPENYAILAEMILKLEPNSVFIILGGASDIKCAEIFKKIIAAKNLEERVLDFTDKIKYRQSAAILSFCDCYIGNDTGTMHIATAVNIPVLAAFCFPADIEASEESLVVRFYPYHVPSVIVQPKHALSECKNSKSIYGCQVRSGPHCITQITPEIMFKAFQLLKGKIAKNETEPLYLS